VTRVAIVDDHGLFRAGVRAELEGHVELVGEAASVDEAVALVTQARPDVVLLDVHMPDGGGVAVIRGAADQSPGTLFLALSASDAAEDVIATIRAGARGYVTKNIATDELLDAIARVQAGRRGLLPAVRGLRARRLRRAPRRCPRIPSSTSSPPVSARSTGISVYAGSGRPSTG
jgi:DNA-binding NarL/FixJ family response regulator